MTAESLVEWLSARLEEDEAVAEAATAGPWRWRASRGNPSAALVNDCEDGIGYDAILHVAHDLPGQPEPADAAHIAAWDPARVLAEVAAKRAILAEHRIHWPPSLEMDDVQDLCEVCEDRRNHDAAPWPCTTLRLLALPYAGRDGWREEWRSE